MKKYKKGKKILTQKELKECARNKIPVWVKYTILNPEDKCKEMNEAIIPESNKDHDGFYLGGAFWDNSEDDNEQCCVEGFDGAIITVCEAIEKNKTKYSFKFSSEELVKLFLENIPEEIEELAEDKIKYLETELYYMIVCLRNSAKIKEKNNEN